MVRHVPCLMFSVTDVTGLLSLSLSLSLSLLPIISLLVILRSRRTPHFGCTWQCLSGNSPRKPSPDCFSSLRTSRLLRALCGRKPRHHGAARLCRNQKLSILHNLLLIYPDIELPSDDINVCRRIPLRSGVLPIRIAKGNMHSWILLILQNLSNHVLQLNIGSNRELA